MIDRGLLVLMFKPECADLKTSESVCQVCDRQYYRVRSNVLRPAFGALCHGVLKILTGCSRHDVDG